MLCHVPVTPHVLCLQENLGSLNSQLSSNGSGTLPMNRFRPNLVLAGVEGGAWTDDTWGSVAIGGAQLSYVKPCDRCKVTTINQETGEEGTEPLTTLGQIRWAAECTAALNAAATPALGAEKELSREPGGAAECIGRTTWTGRYQQHQTTVGATDQAAQVGGGDGGAQQVVRYLPTFSKPGGRCSVCSGVQGPVLCGWCSGQLRLFVATALALHVDRPAGSVTVVGIMCSRT